MWLRSRGLQKAHLVPLIGLHTKLELTSTLGLSLKKAGEHTNLKKISQRSTILGSSEEAQWD